MSPLSPQVSTLSASGIAFALSSYVLWGITPVYWKAVTSVPAAEVLIPRVLWTALFLLVLTRATGQHSKTWEADLKGWSWTLVAALLLACNWCVFIYAVQSDRVIATSLGYYINPLASIVLGLVVVGERLNPLQALAVVIAGAGVATMTLQAGTLPWISLVLAGSFALYGLIHKLAPRPALAGLTREMIVLSPIALLALAWLLGHSSSEPGLVNAPPETQALLSLTSVVTAAPLLLFHAATRRLPLIAVGMFQYISPTITLLLAVAVYGEEFTWIHALGFGCVWIGLAIFTFDSVWRVRTLARAAGD
jgi:chloramphenicol-sensitive protein RarD